VRSACALPFGASAQLGTWRWDGTEGPDAVQGRSPFARCWSAGLSRWRKVSFENLGRYIPPETKVQAKKPLSPRAFLIPLIPITNMTWITASSTPTVGE